MAMNIVEARPKQKKSLTDYVSDGLGVIKTGLGAANELGDLIGGAATKTANDIASDSVKNSINTFGPKPVADFSEYINSADKFKRRYGKILNLG